MRDCHEVHTVLLLLTCISLTSPASLLSSPVDLCTLHKAVASRSMSLFFPMCCSVGSYGLMCFSSAPLKGTGKVVTVVNRPLPFRSTHPMSTVLLFSPEIFFFYLLCRKTTSQAALLWNGWFSKVLFDNKLDVN